MPSNNSLLTKLQADYPSLKFLAGKRFKFTPPNKIYYVPFLESEFTSVPEKELKGKLGKVNVSPFRSEAEKHALLTLHELAHAILKHKDYTLHIQRLKIESRAWQETKRLATVYNIPWDEDFAQDQLDTYRDWLHQKSLCPTCHLNRYQDPSGTYHCPHCRT